jgi:hypothetical protein
MSNKIFFLAFAALLAFAGISQAATYLGDHIFMNTITFGQARILTHADQACITTCVTGCLFGQNTAALTYAIVDCTDATADRCFCL